MEEAGRERAVGAGEGGVVVQREAGGPRLVVRVGGKGGGGSLQRERVRADGLEGGFRAEGSPLRGRRRRGDGGEPQSAAEHLVLLLISLGRGCRGWAFNAKTGGPRMACRWGQYFSRFE